MDKTALLKRIKALAEEFERGRVFGSVEIIFRFGLPSVVHKLTTEKFHNERETTRYERKQETRNR